ncbi:plastocyanin/azurin family copper-binding protein [Streptomyces cocklensis]|uniref:Plastocyanin n=1 Tax=Actinacidiphila cocklensis TaxID=887465 RepID=A0A9W4DWK5_9ACTN|nr:plastocyanin/azurin family copper-binding protein [Actinacidiphila cocklensis]MDD1064095.1 plastocyanin/azurin family copper-binding protein [Actinacidiphila cocklensis]WSX75707.1 plastocyanin/azurin family copper-binding protein [Streptomyces sp. NBC_00899]CAG6395235.1 Plastocyanin [Actinacidiphila cocklensis]
MKKLVPLVLAVALAPVLTACGSDAKAQPVNKAPVIVTIKNMAFNPSRITVAKGQTVEWRWDDGGMPHDVSGDGANASVLKSELRTAGTYRHTFDKTGTFTYHCTPHPAMTGSVVVEN